MGVEQPELKRGIGLRTVVSTSAGLTFASSTFLVVVQIACYLAGDSAWIAITIAGLLCLLAAAALMLDHVKLGDKAERLRKAIDDTLNVDKMRTGDLGGTANSLVLDLNFLYHPSCRYDFEWQCPLAPAGNTTRLLA